MIYMVLFWIVLGVELVHYHFFKKEDWAYVINVIAASLLAMAIFTRDPLFSGFGVPLEFEWVVGLAMVSLFVWRHYLNPLKEKVLLNEKVIILIDSKFDKKIEVINVNLKSIKSDLKDLKKDMHLVKVYILKKS